MSRFFLRLIILLLPLTSVAQLKSTGALAAKPCRMLAQGRKSVGVVLEGGVALGLAHVGVLRWLEQNKIPVDCIAGTSMGGLIAALYSMGYSPGLPTKEEEECFAEKREDCPKNMQLFLKRLLDQDRWESVFYDLDNYRNLSFSRKIDRRAYPNPLRFRLNRSIHLPEGIVPGHRVGLVFDNLAWPYSGVQSFDDLPLPFRCVATDLKSRTSDVLGTNVFASHVGAQGRLSEALRATMSLPVYFTPAEFQVTVAGDASNPKEVIEEKRYVDGGMLDNLPVNALKNMGADVIIAVHLNEHGPAEDACNQPAGRQSAAAAKTPERTLFDAMSDTLSVVTSSNERESIKELAQHGGLLINVNVAGLESTDFNKWSQFICRGFRAPVETSGFKESVLQGADKLSLNDQDYENYRKEVKARREEQIREMAHPEYVTVETDPTAPPDAKPDPEIARWIRGSLSCRVLQPGRYDCPKFVPGQFTEKQAKGLAKQLDKMVGTGRFSRLGYHMLTADGPAGRKSHVAITADQQDYTGAEVQPIITVDGSDYQNPIFALGARFTAFDYGIAGSEWRGQAVIGSRYGVNTEYQIPLAGPASHWFIESRAVAESVPYNIYHDQDELARYQLRTISGALDMGYNFGSAAQVRVGYEGGGAKLTQKLGATIFPFTSGRTGTTSLGVSLDLLTFSLKKLEAPVVPRNGISMNSIFQWHDAWIGATDHFASAAAGLEAFKSVKHTGGSFYLKADGGSSLGYINNGLPLFSLGTPLRLAAFGTNELRMNQFVYGGVGYVHRIYEFKALGGAIYATGSFEMAKVYGVPGAPDLPRDGVAGVILNSIVGPLYVGGTLGNAGHKKFFFYMGRIF